MSALYNDNDKHVAAWLRELIRCGHLPEGRVDERGIKELQPKDLWATSHFFAGIGGWPRALQLAEWPTERPVWTGSCPCQPFSTAGNQLGTADKRHLWPAWLRLIRERRPPTIFGEQVASRLGREWLAGVRTDLEALGYAVGAADLCAAGVGAPHIRQRLFWVAQSTREQVGRVGQSRQLPHERMADVEQRSAERHRLELDEAPRRVQTPLEEQRIWNDAGDGGNAGGLGNPAERGLQRLCGSEGERAGRLSKPSAARCSEMWFPFDLLPCADGKSRRVEPGTFPLAHGVPARVGRLRGYGNAIVPQIAAIFIRAAIEALENKQC